MERRQVLQGAGAAALGMLAANAVSAAQPTSQPGVPPTAQSKGKKEPLQQHHHHGGAYASLVMMASACVEKAQLCLAHCLILLGDGEKEMAACAKAVNQTLAVCAALQNLGAQESKHLREMARLAVKVCRDCEIECEKHAAKHQPCKDCLDACVDCRKECEALAKA